MGTGPLPPGKTAIGCRWVFKLKLKADGSVDKHKARLVAKGYNQVEVRRQQCLFARILEEEIFMEAPDGYPVPDGHSKNDYCLFTKTSDLGFLVLLLYVDDILVAGICRELIDDVKYYLDGLFTIKDLGVAKYFLGLEIARRSLTGYCIFLGDAFSLGKRKTENTVSRSTAEAEYRSMGSTVCELWIMFLLFKTLVLRFILQFPFLCDNQAALHIVANPSFT
ncbi:Retrovirus-related Pol polyprotein from transposon RE2 [Sesamum angolense]|uniref:Retrovirus-related Pol polyprotein from transposon RE2 n=1 Tax=Sesamum angolense TaxID=2727404 RepID=A0AAE1WK67_9LAMI|nr:Retrovirus-related Pol polyprotein from transposon RE2 [Sesamum angolense]